MCDHIEFLVINSLIRLFSYQFDGLISALLKVSRRYSKKPNFELLDFSCEDCGMGKSKGKRKMDDAGVGEQPKDQESGLVTDTDYHIGSIYSRTFQQIYEDYKTDKAPECREERETWLKVKRSGLPLIAARPALLPFHDMTRWILSKCRAKGVVLKADGSNLISFAPYNVAAIYRLPKLEDIVDEAYMKAFAGRYPDYDDCIQEWWFDDDAFKPSPLRVYRV